MNLKIVNGKKFLRSIILIFIFIMIGSFIIVNKTLSHAEVKFKTICISNGDTLWDIAKEEQISNDYYKNKDIRNIIYDIKLTNHMSNSNLKTNQELKIREL